MKLKGIMGAPTTAFNPDGGVDYDTFERQINFLIEQGFPFIAHPMHIGESLNLKRARAQGTGAASCESRRGPRSRVRERDRFGTGQFH